MYTVVWWAFGAATLHQMIGQVCREKGIDIAGALPASANSTFAVRQLPLRTIQEQGVNADEKLDTTYLQVGRTSVIEQNGIAAGHGSIDRERTAASSALAPANTQLQVLLSHPRYLSKSRRHLAHLISQRDPESFAQER